MLNIKNLNVIINGQKVVKSISLAVDSGETHIIMGPNGSGKSSLAHTIMGDPEYQVEDKAELLFKGKNIALKPVDERSRLGIFLSFQNPLSLEGVTVSLFLRQLYQIHHPATPLPLFEFKKLLLAYLREVGLKEAVLGRALNDGFSGGERKRMELLQAKVINPKLAIFDEIDSGLDAQGVKIAALQIKNMAKAGTGCIVITHSGKIAEYLKPTRIHIMIKGNLIHSGGLEVLKQVEKTGYESFI